MKYIIVLLLCFKSYAGGNHDSGKKKVDLKKHSAVQEFSEEDGFKLTKKSIENFGVIFEPINGDGPWKIPKSSLVRIKHSTGVYRKWDGWITMVLVKVVSRTEGHFLVKSVDLQSGDEIAISGVSLLRMTDADLNSDTVDACAH